jgi:hypothetical protein
MHDAMHGECRVRMGGRARGFNIAALMDPSTMTEPGFIATTVAAGRAWPLQRRE